jgi:hypothetical protein
MPRAGADAPVRSQARTVEPEDCGTSALLNASDLEKFRRSKRPSIAIDCPAPATSSMKIPEARGESFRCARKATT